MPQTTTVHASFAGGPPAKFCALASWGHFCDWVGLLPAVFGELHGLKATRHAGRPDLVAAEIETAVRERPDAYPGVESTARDLADLIRTSPGGPMTLTLVKPRSW